MLGTFVRNGLDQRQAESEILTTMYVQKFALPNHTQRDKSLIVEVWLDPIRRLPQFAQPCYIS
jgi:hypothetical protein